MEGWRMCVEMYMNTCLYVFDGRRDTYTERFATGFFLFIRFFSRVSSYGFSTAHGTQLVLLTTYNFTSTSAGTSHNFWEGWGWIGGCVYALLHKLYDVHTFTQLPHTNTLLILPGPGDLPSLHGDDADDVRLNRLATRLD